MFDGLLVNVLILLVSLIVLDKASDVTIDSSVKVADSTGLGKTTVGFILVAFSTSLPELSVSIFSVTGQENIGVAIGNVLGSNIMNICLILGICFLLATLKNSDKASFFPSIVKEEVESLYFGLFIASIIPLALIYIGYASRLIGAMLLAVFGVYTYQLSTKKSSEAEVSVQDEREKVVRFMFLTFLGATGVVIGSYFVVDSASYIAVSIGIPRIVIGATIVAFGTSLPELATSIGATKKGHLDLALGNIVGSGFINMTCILGVTLVGSQLIVNMVAFSNLIVFSLMTNLFLWYFLSNGKTGRREGAILLFMYFLFLIVSFGGYRT